MLPAHQAGIISTLRVCKIDRQIRKITVSDALRYQTIFETKYGGSLTKAIHFPSLKQKLFQKRWGALFVLSVVL
jgi:hypothetical protein